MTHFKLMLFLEGNLNKWKKTCISPSNTDSSCYKNRTRDYIWSHKNNDRHLLFIDTLIQIESTLRKVCIVIDVTKEKDCLCLKNIVLELHSGKNVDTLNYKIIFHRNYMYQVIIIAVPDTPLV